MKHFTRTAAGALLAALLLLAPAGLASVHAQQTDDDPWATGDHARARTLYEQRLAADSADTQALHRLGLLLGWNREFRGAIHLLDRLVAAAPSAEARRDRANVLAWSGDYGRALADVDALLRDDPTSVELRLMRARFLSWAGRLDAATAVYAGLVADGVENAEALRGLARVTSWRGDLSGGEHLWRRALSAEPDDADARVGLSQVLRWRGQPRAALEEAREAVRLAPDNREAQTQLAWAEAAFRMRFAPSFAAAEDSDDNRLLTSALAVSGYAGQRVALSASAYVRRAQVVGFGVDPLDSRAASMTARVDAGRGWTVSAGGGVVDRTAADAPVQGSWHGAIASPGFRPLSGSVSFAHSVLDGTAALIARGVTTDELNASVALRPARGVRWDVGAGVARFNGSRDNQRVLARTGLELRVIPAVRLHPRVTAFRFEHDLDDGYFDPDFYGLAEIGMAFDHYRGPWSFSAEVAPGAQQVGRDAPVRGAVSGGARAGYTLAPGRDIGLSLALSNLGMERFEPQAAGYRYRALMLSLTWGL